MKNQLADDQDSFALLQKSSPTKPQSIPQQSHTKPSLRTPQFPYTKLQLFIIYAVYLWMFVYVVGEYWRYLVENYDEIKPNLVKSWLSDFLESYVVRCGQERGKGSVGSEDLQPVEIFDGLRINIYRYSHDAQWQAYRSNLCVLILAALSWRFLTHLFYLLDRFILSRQFNPYSQCKFSYTNSYIFVFSLMFLLFSFRADLVFYFGIIISWWMYVEVLVRGKRILYKVENKNGVRVVGLLLTLKRYNSIVIISYWLIMLVTLYLNELTGHFRLLSIQFQKLIPQFLSPFKNSYRAIHCSQLLNMTFLRLLSYGIDRIHQGDLEWEEEQRKGLEKKMVVCEECGVEDGGVVRYCYRGRDHVVKETHSLRDYLNYTLFTPLLLTGPPISYNNFFSYNTFPSPHVTFPQLFYHTFLLLSFQLFQHIFPIFPLTPHMTLLQMEYFSLIHLIFIWYKFLIIWKTARIWAQLYGVHVIDNMSRCIFNNYGFEGFWRMWHRGFNHWLIRYLYVPLGGKNNIFSILAVVSFVAFWHDHTINIIFWALIIALFMVPQILIKRYFRLHYQHLYRTYWFKYIAGLCSSIYIHILIICNCIGFGYGIGKIELIIDKIGQEFTTIIWSVILVTFPTLSMFHKRNLEGNIKNY